MKNFRDRYGPWALVAGASVGLGESFSRYLAERGLNLLLVARRQEPLDALAASIRSNQAVEVCTAAMDLARLDLHRAMQAFVGDREVGLLVFNAAASTIGPFLEQPLDEHLRVIDVNCRGPLILSHLLGAAMVGRGRGGIVLMSSLAGGQGNPWLASYAASKAFNIVLGEGLWDEVAGRGVDVAVCRAGATRTAGFSVSRPKRSVPLADPDKVARRALDALGRGPVVIPGLLNRLADFVFSRILPRRVSIRIMGRATRHLYG